VRETRFRPAEARDDPGPGPAVPYPPGAERTWVRAGIRYCLTVFIALRLGLAVVALAGSAMLAPWSPSAPESGIPEPVGVTGWPAPEMSRGPHNLVTAWERFDALWFLRIADQGYVDGDGSAAFFPLYPLLARLVGLGLGGHPLGGALVVSNLAFLGALLALYFLTSSELSERGARRAVLYTALFPTAFFFLAPYSESLFFLCAILALWAARRGRWPAAGVAAAAAALTRPVGVLLGPILAVEAIHAWREGGRRPLGPILWSAVPVVGLLAYLGFWGMTAGDWFAPFNQQAQWQRGPSFPWTTLVEGTREAFRWLGAYPGGYHLADWLVVVPMLGAAGYALIRFRPVFGLYAWAGILAPLSLTFPGRPLMSMPRFLVVLFPLSWAVADLSLRGRIPHTLVVGLYAGALGIFALLFVNGYFMF
jgi:Mannosyltransferase (PIG-V)